VPQVYSSTHEEIEAFNRRRDEDLKRFRPGVVQRRKRFHERFTPDTRDESGPEPDGQSTSDGEEAWRNSEGERLHDFGVDEKIEFYDEEDIPLAVLMHQRGQRRQ